MTKGVRFHVNSSFGGPGNGFKGWEINWYPVNRGIPSVASLRLTEKSDDRKHVCVRRLEGGREIQLTGA